MGKSTPSRTVLHQLKGTASKLVKSSRENRGAATQQRFSGKKMDSNVGGAFSEQEEIRRLPLSYVVGDCVKRWFKDTLQEAKAGDINMQVLVGQMYYSGYGVPRDAKKGRIWITRASRVRASALKVGDKHPGYNASDSDSEDS